MGASYSGNSKDKMNSDNKMTTEKSNNESTSSSRPLSIQAPKTSGNVVRMENQPRQPKNLQGLLRFAMDSTKAEDAPLPTTIAPIDEERKKFLNDALNSLTVNPIEVLQHAVKILSNIMDLKAEDDPKECENALDKINDYVDSLDMANDFYKIGGFTIFGPCLNSPHSSIRWKAANIIAEVTQNNPYCQEKILEMGLMPILLGMVDTDPSEQARIKALYAVSCIVRGNPLALKYLDINNGYKILMKALQSPAEKLQVKSAFLLSALCSRENSHPIRTKLIKMGLIEQSAGLLSMESILPDTRDRLLSILNSLTANNNHSALRECRRAELCLKMTLERHLKDLKAEEAVDEAQLCAELLDKIFADKAK